eukprot:TRINITY_DN6705_c0_g1_i1.p1 TRINITY_DN6705_c0_g1~~TRINITY_DN6705_c0_g1_i1.p1  ORF type:complete len:210 (+),score=40.23 TRINITY_DN6705_c0_g1_i1:24-653(+)
MAIRCRSLLGQWGASFSRARDAQTWQQTRPRWMASRSQLRPAHEILGVPPDAGVEEVKAAYRRLALRCHPDVAGRDRPQAEEEFKELKAAYSQLLGENDSEEPEAAMRREDRWRHSLFQGDTGSLRQVAMVVAFAAPAGWLLQEVLFGDLANMRAEQALLDSGGWACHFCTCVNKAESLACENCKRSMPEAQAEVDMRVDRSVTALARA